jgi:hypothetical protein
MIDPRDFQEELKKWGIQKELQDWRLKLTGGNKKVREHYERVLKSDSDLEATMILLLSNEDAVLREQLDERAAIRCADGLPGDLLSSVKANMKVKG